jgi:hypothetical protein
MLAPTLLPTEESTDGYLGLERRAMVRYLCERVVICSPLTAGERLWAQVRDISTNGIGLFLCAPLELGTELIIEMKSIDPSQSRILIARVVHATMQEEGRWIIGCKLLTKPTEEQVLALL